MKVLRQKIWNLQRFGITPRGLWQRLVPPNAPPVLLISLPKSGTHLVERAVCLWPQFYRVIKPTIRKKNVERYGGIPHLLDHLRPGQVLLAHAGHSKEIEAAIARNGVRAVFICRDLRAILASWTHHVVSLKSHYLHPFFKDIEDPRERMRLVLKGDAEGSYPSMVKTFQDYSGWLGSSCHVVRFEKLIGKGGGGSGEVQQAALCRLWDYLSLPQDSEIREGIRNRIVSDASPTFRAGGKIPWQEAFDDELQELFDARAGDLLKRYGYGSGDSPS